MTKVVNLIREIMGRNRKKRYKDFNEAFFWKAATGKTEYTREEE
jgi:hypothetical protein